MTGRKAVPTACATKIKLEIETLSYSEGSTYLSSSQNCRALWGWESSLILLILFCVGFGHAYTLMTYAYSFSNVTSRDGLGVFLCLALLSWILALSILFRVLKAACDERSEKTDGKRDKNDGKERQNRPTVWKQLYAAYEMIFEINGKFYLIKMYLAELLENTLQVVNMTTFYLCEMPLSIILGLCSIMIAEVLFSTWSIFHMDSKLTRNKQLLVDVVTDILLMTVPILYAHLSHKVPIGIWTMIQLTAIPTVGVLSKTMDIWEDLFRLDMHRFQQRNAVGRKSSIRSSRLSILYLPENKLVFETQLGHFPKCLRYGFAVINVAFVLYVSVVVYLQLNSTPSDEQCKALYTPEVWTSCELKVPFCQHLFESTCDCAVLKLKNYSQPVFPHSFGNLSSLMFLGVYGGELKHLPAHLGRNHRKLRHLSVVDNQLSAIPESIGNLHRLIRLIIVKNPLKILPHSLGNLENLVYLAVFNNRLIALPTTIGNLRNLAFLHAWNNRLHALPDTIGSLQQLIELSVFNNQLRLLPEAIGDLHTLVYLSVQNNHLTTLPNRMGNLKRLRSLYAWNNSIKSLPENFGDLNSLQIVDFRHNELRNLPLSIQKLAAVKHFYVAGNYLCPNEDFPSNLVGAQGLCTYQCSTDCPSLWLDNGMCDDNEYLYLVRVQLNMPMAVVPQRDAGCNTLTCNYDAGSCEKSE